MKEMTTIYTCDSCGETEKSPSRPTWWTELNTRCGGPVMGTNVTLHLCSQCTKKTEKALGIKLHTLQM